MTYTVTDLFAGAGGSSTGMVNTGLRVVIAANHSELAVRTHQANHPDTDHDLADISQVDFRRYPKTDFLWASPECFPAGALVTTSRGQTPIEDVNVGDLVLTHRGRWRPVVRTQSRHAATVTVRGQGHPHLEVTPTHRMWARPSTRRWNNETRRYRREFAEPGWMAVREMPAADALWATPITADALETFNPPDVFGLDQESAWWMVGYWVGNGSMTFGRNHEVLITCGFHRSDEIGARLAATGHVWKPSPKRTAMVFYTREQKARDWLHDHFGHGAASKSLPSWTLSLPAEQRRALLDGYLAADGHIARRVHANTVSKKLAVSVRLLAESLGHRVAIGKDKRTSYEIEGRTGAALPQWIVHWEATPTSERYTRSDDLHAWSRVREILPGRDDVEVFNIEVEEDHSYVLDGIVVANCTNHSIAKGRRRVTGQGDLFGADDDDVAIRSRATMFDVPRALEAGHLRGRPYLGGVVENVVDATDWMYWDSWIRMFDAAGYHVRPVFLNSMHARDDRAVPAPQSRDRLYVVFWLKKLGRTPDLNITLPAWCPRCETTVDAVQSWRRPDRLYGKYRQQYDYACSNPRCRVVVEPAVRAAAEVIDWSELGARIGDRTRPLAAATIARIEAGLRKFARPMLTPAGGTWNDGASPVDDPFRTRTTRETEALACPPMLIPTEARAELGRVGSAFEPMRTQTARQELALAVPPQGEPFMVTLRGGGERGKAHSIHEPVGTISTGGEKGGVHHAVVTPPGGQHLLMAYYGNGTCTPVARPVPTQPTGERFALIGSQIAVEDCTFRMLQPKEIAGAMAFPDGYILLGAKRDKVKLLGNAVTPPAAELLMRRLIDAVGAAA